MEKNDSGGRPTRRQTLQATLGGAAALTVGTGLTAAAGDGGGGGEECDASEGEYLAVRDEYADPDQFAAVVESLGGLQAHGVEGGEFLQATTHVATVDCEPVPEYRALWGTNDGGGVALNVRPESGTYRATYRPDVGRGGGSGGETPCSLIISEDYTGCTPEGACCECEEHYLEEDHGAYTYRFCYLTCETSCDLCPGLCGASIPGELVPGYEDVELCC